MSFAAMGDDILAHQALGYWHFTGIATVKSCEEASYYYSRVAEKVVENWKDGPPLGRNLPKGRPSLPEKEAGGVYGTGVSGAGDPTIKANMLKGNALSTKDIVEYYSLQADSGDITAQMVVGQVYYQGAEGVSIDFTRARRYYYMAVKQMPPKESVTGKKKADTKLKSLWTFGGQAAGYLGQMYWRGEGVEANEVTARKWFEKGAEAGNGVCMYGLAVMYDEGLGGLEKVCFLVYLHLKG
jgi:SEL1 protein